MRSQVDPVGGTKKTDSNSAPASLGPHFSTSGPQLPRRDTTPEDALEGAPFAYGRVVTLLLLFNQSPVYETLHATAQRHHDTRGYQESVIFSQMAAEIAADACLTRLIDRVEPASVRPWLKNQLFNTNLGNKNVRTMYTALSGDMIADETWWSPYVEHTQLRNDVAHEGAGVTQQLSQRGLTVTRSLIDHIASVGT